MRLVPVKAEDLQKHSGKGVMNHWNCSLIKAIRECFPEYDWCEWLFSSVPLRFWQKPANRRRFLRWLGIQLGYRRATDWYSISRGRHCRLWREGAGGAVFLDA